jgi:hypothetical protein
MAAPAYSKVLWELTAGYSVPGPIYAPSVPEGYVWVLREITAYLNPGPTGTEGAPMLVVYVTGIPVWQTPLNATTAGRIYEARDVRMVVEATDDLYINPASQEWNLRVSGYQLTA